MKEQHHTKGTSLDDVQFEIDAPQMHKLPLLLKIFAILCIVGGFATVPMIAVVVVVLVQTFQSGGTVINDETTLSLHHNTTASIIILFVLIALLVVIAIGFIVFGARLWQNKRRYAAHTAHFLTVVMIAALLCDIMLFGLDIYLTFYGGFLIFHIVLGSYLDPSLAQERELQHKLRDMETREEAEEGTLGRDESGKGYISLNFFNTFWIFVVCSILGLIIETIYHFALFGTYQDRAGILFGPFSPIYGFGALLMTVALNRFYRANLLVVFLVSAAIGGAFEYLTSWFMQYAFGIVAWDYSGTWLSIDGRTNGMYMIMWGVLGLLWIKLLLPKMLELVNLIPWNWRYSITTVCATLMIANGAMTFVALDCWYGRMAGKAPETAIEEFCASRFDNAFMAERFQSMSINPENSTRTK